MKAKQSNFHNHVSTVGIGDKYESYDDGEISVAIGDFVVWEDPDVGAHSDGCELWMRHEFVCRVTEVYLFNPSYSDGIEAQIGVSAPLGRLDVDDVTIIPDDPQRTAHSGTYGPSVKDARQRIETLIGESLDAYVSTKWHYTREAMSDELWNEMHDPHCDHCENPDDAPIVESNF